VLGPGNRADLEREREERSNRPRPRFHDDRFVHEDVEIVVDEFAEGDADGKRFGIDGDAFRCPNAATNVGARDPESVEEVTGPGSRPHCDGALRTVSGDARHVQRAPV
jgi:hypothetical protein